MTGTHQRLQPILKKPLTGLKVVGLLLATLFYGTSGFLFFERSVKPELDWLDALWWSLVTMTTVGYGDFFPVTSGGRFLVAYPVMLLGMGFLAYGLSMMVRRILGHADRRSVRPKALSQLQQLGDYQLVYARQLGDTVEEQQLAIEQRHMKILYIHDPEPSPNKPLGQPRNRLLLLGPN